MNPEDQDKIKSIRARLERHLQNKPFCFNPDPIIVDAVLLAMVKRKEKMGEEYCPCRKVSGDKEKDSAIICPCVYHEDEIAADGYCHCRLFTAP